MKKLLFLTAACLLPNLVTAQSKLDIDKINEGIKDIPYIFEGYVIDTKPYYGDENGAYFPPDSITNNKNGWGYMHVNGSKVYPYFSVQMQVCTIYKGTNLQHGTIEIVVPVPPKSHIQPEWAEFGDKKHYFTGVGSPSSKPEPMFLPALGARIIIIGNNSTFKYGMLKTENPLIDVNINYCIWLGSEKNETNFSKVIIGTAIKGMTYSILSYEEFTKLFKQLKNINHNAENMCKDSMKVAPPKEEEGMLLDKIDYERNLRNYNQWLNEMKLRQEKSQGNKSTNAASLNISMSDGDLVGTGPNNKYLEFTIFASSDELGTYLDGALLHIAYNTSVFGNNVIASNNISITRLGNFNTSTYTAPDTVSIDNALNTIAVPLYLNPNESIFNRVLLSFTPIPILKIKMRIQNCSNANIDFLNTSFTATWSYYTTTANAGFSDGLNYSNTNYTGNIYDNPCVPIINSFNDHVRAGTGDILTIQGSYFGDKMLDASTVIFYDANRGFAYPDPLGPKKGGIQHYDVLNWSDN